MASRYWVGGTGTWNDSDTSHWSATSGGASGASVPTASDNVFINGSSGGGTITTGSTNPMLNLDFTGFAGTFTGTNVINIYGGITLSTGMTWSATGSMNFYATSGTNVITSNGKSFSNQMTFEGVGGTWQLADAFTNSASEYMILNKGTFDANNNNLSIGIFSSSNTYTRSITMGSGTWTITGVGTAWDLGTTTNLTLSENTSTLKFTNTSSSGLTFAGGGETYNNIWFSRGSSSGNITIGGDNTFADFSDTGTASHSILFTAGTTQTVATFTVSGTASNLITINSTTTDTHALVKTGSGLVSSDYLNIQHSVATPANTWFTGTNSVDNQDVASEGSGWNFYEVPTRQKTFVYRVYNQFGDYIQDWSDTLDTPHFTQEINSAGSEMTVKLARNLDDFGEDVDVAFNNIVKIYVTDNEVIDELFFQGRIVNYAPYYGDTEHLTVTLYSLGYELDYIIYKTAESAEQVQVTGSTEIIIGPDSTIAQSFIPDQTSLTSVDIKGLAEISSTTITLDVRTDVSAVPNTVPITGSTVTKIITNTTAEVFKMTFDTPLTLTVASTYWLVVGAS